jgi:hypothetical protein
VEVSPARTKASWNTCSWAGRSGNVAGVLCVMGPSIAVSMVVRTPEKKIERIAASPIAGRACGLRMLGFSFHESIHLDINPIYSASPSIFTKSLVVPFWYRAAATAYEVVKCTPMLGAGSFARMGSCCGDRTTRALTNDAMRRKPEILILNCSDYNNGVWGERNNNSNSGNRSRSRNGQAQS